VTTGGPPWQIYGPETREPQSPDAVPAGDDKQADDEQARENETVQFPVVAAEVAGPAEPDSADSGPSAPVAGGAATAAPVSPGATTAAPAAEGAATGVPEAAGTATAAGPAAMAPEAVAGATAATTGAATGAGAAEAVVTATTGPGSVTEVKVAPGAATARSATALPQRAVPRAAGRDTAAQRPQGWRPPGPVSPPAEEPRTRPGLSARLSALARLVQIGSSRRDAGFSADLIQDAEQLLGRAGERLRLSDQHTVVALAGGTGSGKSSLFNKLAGSNLSAVGVTRPVTRHTHACVWGAEGSGPLLDWLGVQRRFRYSRDSALEHGEAALNGLVLLDLPDHDSVASGASGQVEKLVGMTDLMVWVLDPQKYADAAVHQRYLVPLAGHSAVIAVVLNQADLLAEQDIEECAGDLRRLLDSEGLQDAPLLVTSAENGGGLQQLRTMLGNAVSQRRATDTRISADLDGIADEFLPYAAEPREGTQPVAGQPDAGVPGTEALDLEDAFTRAAGAWAVVDALESARELRAVDYIGWPIAWLVERLTGRNPIRKIRLGRLWDEVKGIAAGPSGAQQAEIDSALTKFADAVGRPLPKLWAQTTRSAVRSRTDEIPAALGIVMSSALPPEDRVAAWWRVIGAVQGLLLGCVIVSLAWIGALLAFGVFHAINNVPRLFSDSSLLPWVGGLAVALLLAGWLIGWACAGLVRSSAQRERQQVAETIHEGIKVVAEEMVFSPTDTELREYREFLDELRVAAGV
jgi:50S ribosome-binding GTPase